MWSAGRHFSGAREPALSRCDLADRSRAAAHAPPQAAQHLIEKAQRDFPELGFAAALDEDDGEWGHHEPDPSGGLLEQVRTNCGRSDRSTRAGWL